MTFVQEHVFSALSCLVCHTIAAPTSDLRDQDSCSALPGPSESSVSSWELLQRKMYTRLICTKTRFSAAHASPLILGSQTSSKSHSVFFGFESPVGPGLNAPPRAFGQQTAALWRLQPTALVLPHVWGRYYVCDTLTVALASSHLFVKWGEPTCSRTCAHSLSGFLTLSQTSLVCFGSCTPERHVTCHIHLADHCTPYSSRAWAHRPGFITPLISRMTLLSPVSVFSITTNKLCLLGSD